MDYPYSISSEQNRTEVMRRDIQYSEEVLNKKTCSWGIETKQFIDKWFNDPAKRSYVNVVCAPTPIRVADGDFNVWEKFPIEQLVRSINVSEVGRKHLQAQLDRVLDHLSAVAGDNDRCNNYLLDWIASIIQC